jgi:hypothetical protein
MAALLKPFALATVAAGACVPSQIFINYGATPSEMAISWAVPTSGAGVVHYGASPSSLNSVAVAQQVEYSWTFNTTTPDYTSPYIQHALLTDLSPATQYFYTVGGGACGTSAVFNLTSHPGVGAGIPVTFCLIGDLGQTNNSQVRREVDA